MKYANVLHNIGLILVILYGLSRILHWWDDYGHLLLIAGVMVAYSSQAWKVGMLEKRLRETKNTNV